MKAISVQQPWAWAILHAGKNLENRQVRFKYRGPLLIHAPLRRATDRMPRGVREPEIEELLCGVVLGIVDLVDVVDHAAPSGGAGTSRWSSEILGRSGGRSPARVRAASGRRPPDSCEQSHGNSRTGRGAATRAARDNNEMQQTSTRALHGAHGGARC